MNEFHRRMPILVAIRVGTSALDWKSRAASSVVVAAAAAMACAVCCGIAVAQLPPEIVEFLSLDKAAEEQRETAVRQNFGAVSPGVV